MSQVTTAPDLSGWMTKQQVAAALGVSEKTVTRMSDRGELKQETRTEPGQTPRPVFEPGSVRNNQRSGPPYPRFRAPQKLLAAPAVPDPPTKAKALPLSELRFKTFLTTDEAVRYSGLPEAILGDLVTRGKVIRYTNMKPYRYYRRDLEDGLRFEVNV